MKAWTYILPTFLWLRLVKWRCERVTAGPTKFAYHAGRVVVIFLRDRQ